jgi:thiamine-monophosphate kinase
MLAPMGETLSDIGEGGLIALLRERITSAEGVSLGLGDDAAVVATSPLTLATVDAMIEGVHFEIGLSSAADVGYKALACNVSDVAAMGGRARYALVVLGAPEATPLATVEAIYDGLTEAAAEFGVGIVGGDMVRASQLLLSVALLGEPGPAGIVLRSGAREDDIICVTGTLGEAAAGLALLRLAASDAEAVDLLERFPNLAAAHRRGRARAREGPAAAEAGATAMIDCSDGLARDASHIANESGLGLEVSATSLPLGPGVDEAAALLGRDAHELALAGGEDYELAIAIPADRVAVLTAALAPTLLTAVGELTGSDERVLVHDALRVPLAHLGFDHFGRP